MFDTKDREQGVDERRGDSSAEQHCLVISYPPPTPSPTNEPAPQRKSSEGR